MPLFSQKQTVARYVCKTVNPSFCYSEALPLPTNHKNRHFRCRLMMHCMFALALRMMRSDVRHLTSSKCHHSLLKNHNEVLRAETKYVSSFNGSTAYAAIGFVT